MKKNKRLYNIQHPIIAITGGIATGKSTTCKIISEMGFPVVSADEEIKDIYKQDKLRLIIKNRYPGIIKDNQINFKKLRQAYFQNSGLEKELNDYIYPELENKVREFVASYPIDQIIFYEIPLLYEKGLQEQVDVVILVYASEQTQRQRISLRDGADEETTNRLLSNQLSIEDKRKMAKYIIENDSHLIDLDSLKKQIRAILAQFTD